MKRVFLDTSAIYAVLSSSDKFHEVAERKYITLVDSGYELWITEWVFEECVSLVWYRAGKDNGIKTAQWLLENFDLYRFDKWEIKKILDFSKERKGKLKPC